LGISQSAEGNGDLKLHSLLQFIETYQVDAFVFAEHNTCWDLLLPNEQLPIQTKGWWENSYWSVLHNRTEKYPRVYQLEGTSLVAVNSLSHWASTQAMTQLV